ncbi:hypothetical protein NLU13_6137 [Sarocladium strictum]|uniref:Pre-mRNA-splicing factor n=1 Tax=Sarocladium strictum TaxID=5046 RepID=A0AA39L700_SARSR|nr:hypothetical protein NLU13_6137 [Sarocladium strictum]
MSQPNGAGRIAIKFGSGAPSKNSSRPAPPSSLGKRSRPQPWGQDDESGSDDDIRGGAHEKITGFGASGAENEEKRDRPEKKEYVIARQPNRDWKAEARGNKRGRHASPPGVARQQNGGDVETEPADQDKGIKWGLTITKKDRPEDEDAHNAEPDHEAPPDETSKSPPPAPRTVDDEAMDALLGKAPKKDELVIPSAPATEDSAYQAAVAEAGEASTLADYEAMPVEEFGAALLRGMGWDGKERAPARKPVVRRPNRLGLGAKELKDAEDLGAWDQGKKRSGGRDKRPPKLSDYRREEEKRKERRGEDSYKRERERERERDRHRGSDRRERDYGSDRHKYRDRDHERHHRR